MMSPDKAFELLLPHAMQARENASAAETKVGCAILDERGKVWVGCNVEHDFQHMTLHAEVNAVGSMVAGGGRRVEHVVIAANRDKFTPCGACRDVLMQYGRGCLVQVLDTRSGKITVGPGAWRRASRATASDMSYQVIYADPPWRYADKRAGRGGAEAHYRTMGPEEILALRPPADTDAALLMWATWPMLPDAMAVIRAWGFEYRTLGLIWVKTTKKGQGEPFDDARPPLFWGCGQWTRSNTEPCLLAIRGAVKPPADRGVHQVICAPAGAHSRKPAEARRRIERMFPGQRMLEMFAREAAPGWDRWGDEAPTVGAGERVELAENNKQEWGQDELWTRRKQDSESTSAGCSAG